MIALFGKLQNAVVSTERRYYFCYTAFFPRGRASVLQRARQSPITDLKTITTDPAMRILLAALLLLPLSAHSEDRQLLWGDTHLHTTYSSDAYTNNNLTADPDDAYNYAKGRPVIHPFHRARVQIETPLDFLVVSDHAELLGGIRSLHMNGPDTSDLGLWAACDG